MRVFLRTQPKAGRASGRTVDPLPGECSEWHASWEIEADLSAQPTEEAQVSVQIEAQEAWYLSHARRLLPLTGAVCPPFPVGRFVVVLSRDGLFKYGFPWGTGFRVSRSNGRVEVTATVLDRPRCGLSLWGTHKLIPPVERSLRLRFYRDKLLSLDECLWVEPYPYGARAAVCLTDHADFDTVEKLNALAQVFLRNGLRFTKSVFPQTDPLGEKREPGLDVADYRSLISELHAHGTEVAFHGFGPRVRAPSVEECLRRAELLLPFGPATWIDHGIGDYLFSRQARLNGGARLTDLLRRFGVRNYWSCVDVWENPFRSLSSWRARRPVERIVDPVVGTLLVRPAGLKGWLQMALQPLRNTIGTPQVEKLRAAPRRWRAWAEALGSRRLAGQIQEAPLLIYGLDGSEPTLRPDGEWVFDTVLINHPAVQLRPRLLDRLFRESGLLLGHSYLSCDQARFAGACRRGPSGVTHVSSRFLESMEYLAQRQRLREVVSLSFAELRQCLITCAEARLARIAKDAWRLRTDGPVKALTVAGPCRWVAGCRADGASVELRAGLGLVHLASCQDAMLRFGLS